MLINCSECGKEVSDKAPACPACGNPIIASAATTARTKPKKSASLGTKIVRTTLAVFVGVVVIAVIAGNNASKSVSTLPADASTSSATTAPAAQADDPTPQVESSAVRSARQYLSFSGFSRKGLIRQLSSDAGDRYDVTDATSAVDSLGIDWNEQAARSAKQYLEFSGFSCKGLIQQLSAQAGDQYTKDQATYGAKSAGACT